MPFCLAQIAGMGTWWAGTTMLILGSTISFVKIFYVTHFNFVFSQNQEFVSQLVLGTSLVAGCVPHLVICIHQSAQGIQVVPSENYLMGQKIKETRVFPTVIYGSCWLFISLIMLMFAVLFIKNYERRNRQLPSLSSERERVSGKSISLAKVLLGVGGLLLGVITSTLYHLFGESKDIPIILAFYVIVICGMLLAFVLDEKIMNSSRHKISGMLKNTYKVLKKILRCQTNTVSPQ